MAQFDDERLDIIKIEMVTNYWHYDGNIKMSIMIFVRLYLIKEYVMANSIDF